MLTKLKSMFLLSQLQWKQPPLGTLAHTIPRFFLNIMKLGNYVQIKAYIANTWNYKES